MIRRKAFGQITRHTGR